jgi:hypothetical protein
MSLTLAKTIQFTEEKYIQALDNTIKKQGTLHFEANKIMLTYKNSMRKLIYENDTLHIQINNEIQTLNLNNQQALRMIFLLIQSIMNDDFTLVQEYFTITIKEGITQLTPKQNISAYIDFIRFKKDTLLHFITISMTNGNSTTIREIND